MKLIITGGCGFVGGNLAAYFAENGHEVIAIDSMIRKGSRWNANRLRDIDVRVVVDSAGGSDIRHLFDPPASAVLHCAAQPSAIAGFADPWNDFGLNTVVTHNILNDCRVTGTPIIYWSTNKVFSAGVVNSRQLPDPNLPIDGGDKSIYGATKLCGDLLCQEYATAFNIPVVVNRFSCLAGPWQFGKTEQGWVAWFVIAAEFGLPITFYGWGGHQVRDILFMPDICTLIEKQIQRLEEHRGAARVYQVGGGAKNATSLVEFTNRLKMKYGYKLSIAVSDQVRKSDHRYYVSAIDRVCKDYQWEPKVGIEEGTDQIVQWVKDNREKIATLL